MFARLYCFIIIENFVSVPAYVIAVDYDRYAILIYCLFESNKSDAYVLYRNQYPDKTTVKDVLKKLKENKIDISQFVEYGTDHCQKGEELTEEVPLRNIGLGNGTQPSAILNTLEKYM